MATAVGTQYSSVSNPTFTRDGLAIYRAGYGEPLLLMPYPHGFPLRPMVEEPLAGLLVRIGRHLTTCQRHWGGMAVDEPAAAVGNRNGR